MHPCQIGTLVRKKHLIIDLGVSLGRGASNRTILSSSFSSIVISSSKQGTDKAGERICLLRRCRRTSYRNAMSFAHGSLFAMRFVTTKDEEIRKIWVRLSRRESGRIFDQNTIFALLFSYHRIQNTRSKRGLVATNGDFFYIKTICVSDWLCRSWFMLNKVKWIWFAGPRHGW